jgi:hypothetical protein
VDYLDLRGRTKAGNAPVILWIASINSIKGGLLSITSGLTIGGPHFLQRYYENVSGEFRMVARVGRTLTIGEGRKVLVAPRVRRNLMTCIIRVSEAFHELGGVDTAV